MWSWHASRVGRWDSKPALSQRGKTSDNQEHALGEDCRHPWWPSCRRTSFLARRWPLHEQGACEHSLVGKPHWSAHRPPPRPRKRAGKSLHLWPSCRQASVAKAAARPGGGCPVWSASLRGSAGESSGTARYSERKYLLPSGLAVGKPFCGFGERACAAPLQSQRQQPARRQEVGTENDLGRRPPCNTAQDSHRLAINLNLLLAATAREEHQPSDTRCRPSPRSAKSYLSQPSLALEFYRSHSFSLFSKSGPHPRRVRVCTTRV